MTSQTGIRNDTRARNNVIPEGQWKATGGAPSASLRWSKLQVWCRVGLILVAVALACAIALQTCYRAHPDEYWHVDAFRYFDNHWWPPDLGFDGLIYSPDGWSRVYNGEIVYIIYGKLGKMIQIFWKPEEGPYLIYRLINVILFLLTLVALFFVRCRCVDPALVGLTFICIPQVHYIYAYANSDAWGLSVGVFLFLLAAIMTDGLVQSWSWGKFGLLGGLTGLILASKTPYLLSLLLPYSLITMRVVHAVQQGEVSPIQWLGRRLIVVGLVVVTIAAPLKIVYPMTQGDFSSAVERMRESKARNGFRPSNPTYATYHLASRGETYFDMLTKRPWVDWSLKSFYGTFGYMNVWNPPWIYQMAGFSALLGLCLTVFGAVRHWRKLHDGLRACLILSPIFVIVNVCASLYHSLHFDFQPQGRYLFPSLIAVSLMLTGTIRAEGGKLKAIRAIVFVVIYAICLYSLIFLVATNPALK